MTRRELREALQTAGVDVKRSMLKEELEQLYDKFIHVHRLPNEPTTEPVEPAEPGETTEPDGSELDEPTEPTEGEPPVEGEPSKDAFDEILGKISGAKAPEPKQRTEKDLFTVEKKKRGRKDSDPGSFHLQGYVLLLIMDTIFPWTFSFLNNLLDKRVQVKVTDLKLPEDDFKQLIPLADQAAAYLSINLNPVVGFLLVSTFMYGNVLIVARMRAEDMLINKAA